MQNMFTLEVEDLYSTLLTVRTKTKQKLMSKLIG